MVDNYGEEVEDVIPRSFQARVASPLVVGAAVAVGGGEASAARRVNGGGGGGETPRKGAAEALLTLGPSSSWWQGRRVKDASEIASSLLSWQVENGLMEVGEVSTTSILCRQ